MISSNYHLEKIRKTLRLMLAEELHMQAGDIREEKKFVELGVSSRIGMIWISRVNEEFELSIPAVRAYNYPTLKDFAKLVLAEGQKQGLFQEESAKAVVSTPRHLATPRRPALAPARRSFKKESAKTVVSTPPKLTTLHRPTLAPIPRNHSLPSHSRSTPRMLSKSEKVEKVLSKEPPEIAVIGISGRYPKAKNIEEFWKNLRDGKDCITEVPKERWDHSLYFDEDKNKPGKTYGKWGGFLGGVDQFDPQFFNISPSEAKQINPEERLFLETAWNVFENSGYTRQTLQARYQNKVGVYVGVMYQHYHYYLQASTDSVVCIWANGSIANRVSYFFNLQGPSIAIDTTCSSSAIAIHMACESLSKSECSLAIAGGVNLSIHPRKFLGLSQIKMIGSHLNSRSFAEGDGYHPAEAVGAVLLKPLSNAIQDRDSILAIIRSTSTNHGGHSNGYSVPNPNAQTQLIEDNLTKSGIDPRTISYVESAANGSLLGDPIELTALHDAFRKFTSDQEFCAIGSVKSNIGHAEAASGISQLTKVILQLQHQQLVPSIKATPLNPNLDFKDSPFYIQEDLQEWKRPRLKSNGEWREYPRRAAISSFGAGGSNAHIIVEEYNQEIVESQTGKVHEEPTSEKTTKDQFIIVLSAKNSGRLKAMVKNLYDFVSDKILNLRELAYTLQVGREAMESRLAMVVNNHAGLILTLEEYLKSIEEDKNIEFSIPIYQGNLEENASESQSIFSGTTGESIAQLLLAEKNYEKLALYWTQGGAIPWQFFYQGKDIRIITLPNYPFARKRYWLSEGDTPTSENIEKNKDSHSSTQSDERLGVGRLNGRLEQRISELLDIPVNELPTRKSLNSLGFNSVMAITLCYKLEQDFSTEIPISAINDHQTIEQLKRNLEEIVQLIPPDVQSGENIQNLDQKNTLTKQIRTDKSNILPKIIRNTSERYKPFPLTDIQESYFVGRYLGLGNDRVGCHNYFEYEVIGLDITRLENAWQRLVAHHDMLRCMILSDVRQVIQQNTAPFEFKIYRMSEKKQSELSEHLDNLRKSMSHKIYDIEEYPLYDIRITECAGQRFIVHFSIDSWIIDGFSFRLLLRQWSLLYDQPEKELAVLGMSFRDYVIGVKNFESSDRCKRDLEYWTNRLEGMPDGPSLLFGHGLETQNGDGFSRKRLTGSLQKTHWNSLKKRAESLGFSPTALLLRVFSEALLCESSRNPFSLILTYFNRLPLHPQVDQVLGPFISTNIFIVDDLNGYGFTEKVKLTQEQLLQDLNHSNVGGIRVLRELKAKRRISNSVSFPVVFTSALSEMKQEKNDVCTLEMASYAVSQTPGIYLDHQASERKGDLDFSWDVAEGHFKPGVIDEIFSNYCRMLLLLSTEDEMWQREDWPSKIIEHSFLQRDLAPHGKLLVEGFSPNLKDNILTVDIKLQTEKEERYSPFPLTNLQESYAFGRSGYLNGGNQSCQFYYEFEVNDLDVEKLEQAWQKLIAVHDMLRTVIQLDGTQKLLKKTPQYKIEVADLTKKKKKECDSILKDIKCNMIDYVFPLNKWPNFEVRVSRTGKGKTRIHIIIDMMIADFYSIQLLLYQMARLYSNPDENIKVPEPSFRDYILSLHRYKKTSGYQKDLKYWEKKFDTLPSAPLLPLNTKQTSQPRLRVIWIGGILENWKTLKEKAKNLSVSPSMILLTAFAEVLADWSKDPRFSIVVPCFDRAPIHNEIYDVVGDFTAMGWVVRSESKLTFEERVWLNHKQLTEDLSKMPESNLTVLRKKSMGKKSRERLSFPVVFSNLIDLQTLNLSKRFQLKEMSGKTPQVTLDSINIEKDGILHLQWDMLNGVYPPGMVEDMFSAYRRILSHLSSDPESWKRTDFHNLIKAQSSRSKTVSSDSLTQVKINHQGNGLGIDNELSEDAKRKILEEWNDTEVSYQRDKFIHELFEEKALQCPDNVATIYEGRKLTYEQVNRQANQLAWHLRKKGIKAEKFVGICMDRSAEMVNSLLGILKAGGAYVPLEPSYPKARLGTIIETAEIKTIVTQKKYSVLFSQAEVELIYVDEDAHLIAAEKDNKPPVAGVNSQNTAYVIFTSGSTGKPKGVVVQHRPVINLIEWAEKTFEFNANDVGLFVTALSFDLSVFDVFGLLSYGASIYIVGDKDRTNSKQLTQLLCREQISFWNSAPATLQLLVPFIQEERRTIKNSTLRLIFLSGDWIPLSLPDEMRDVFPKAEVISLGGATEATVWSNYYPIGNVDSNWRSIPYGRPIQNARYYVLDKNQSLCPIGIKGNLYIGGECLSKGYMNAPHLTNESFFPDPFAKKEDGIMYRTGDLARFFPDGIIEFLGRKDAQVKIRGFRIELGEIEYRLKRHDKIKDAVVLVKEDQPGDQKIVAYIVTSQGTMIEPKEVRSFCKKALPDYMAPNFVISLAELPVTSNGKVDRKSLPWPIHSLPTKTRDVIKSEAILV